MGQSSSSSARRPTGAAAAEAGVDAQRAPGGGGGGGYPVRIRRTPPRRAPRDALARSLVCAPKPHVQASHHAALVLGPVQGQAQTVAARGYPGQPPTGQRIPMSNMQQYYLEGMRPERGLPRGVDPPAQMRKTQTIRNDVNLKKTTLRLVQDEAVASSYHLEFSFDASTPCGITVFYAATESLGADGTSTFAPLMDEGALPTVYHEKGLGQNFRTDPSLALDVSKYARSDLGYHAGPPARFPVVVVLAAGRPGVASNSAVSSQTTFADIVFADDGVHLKVRPLKQKIQVGRRPDPLWRRPVLAPDPLPVDSALTGRSHRHARAPQVESTSYELQEIYGIEGATPLPADQGGGAEDGGGDARECVICMTDPRDTTVLPCRHMCMCSDCAKQLLRQSEKCPICRGAIDQLLQVCDASPQRICALEICALEICALEPRRCAHARAAGRASACRLR